MATVNTRPYYRPRKGRSGFDLLHASDTPEDAQRLAAEGYKPADPDTARAAMAYNSKGWAQGEDAYRLGLKERPVEVSMGTPHIFSRISQPMAEDWGDAKRSGMSNPPAWPRSPGITVGAASKAPDTYLDRLKSNSTLPGPGAKAPFSEDELSAMFEGTGGSGTAGESADSELEAAQEQARDRRLVAEIGRAGAQFNEALSGAKYDRAAYDGYGRDAERPVGDLLQRREAVAQRQGRARLAQQDRMRAEAEARAFRRQQQQDARQADADAYRRQRDALGDERYGAEQRESARRFDLSRQDAAANRALQRQSQADTRALAQQQRQDAARARAEAQAQENALKRGEKLGQATTKAPFGELQQALQGLDELAPGLIYGDESAQTPLSTKDRVVNALPFGAGDRLMSDKALQYKSNLQNLRDLITRARSGAAINESEERHYLSLLGDDILSDPRRAAAGINAVRQGIGQKLRDAQLAYSGPTLDAYEQGGGTTYRNRVFGNAPPKRQGPVRIQSPDGRTGTIDPSELDEAVRNGWKVL